MAKLTVTIITFNEEKNIDRCLQSVKPVADEIIVVDSLSADKTKEICLRHQVTFIEQPFLGYIQQKNFALAQSSNQHALGIDADEWLSEELVKSILKEKDKDFPCDGYTMNRFNYYCGQWIKHGTFYPDRKLRLLDLKKGQWGGQNPHDKIIMQEGAKIRKLNGDLLHYTYQSYQEQKQQAEKFSGIAAKALFDRGKKPSWRKLVINPVWAFIQGYIIKLGFLDGKAGFRIAMSTALQSYLKYKKLIRLHRQTGNNKHVNPV